MRGRKPKPDALIGLTGGRRRRNPPANVPGLPDTPTELGPSGRAEWERLTDAMGKAGTLSPKYGGVILLAALCAENVERCRADVAANGVTYKTDTFVKRNPAVAELRSWMSLHLRCLESLGLTPSSNQRVQSEGEPPINDVENEFFGNPLKIVNG